MQIWICMSNMCSLGGIDIENSVLKIVTTLSKMVRIYHQTVVLLRAKALEGEKKYQA